MAKVFVCSRFTHLDKYLFVHYMKHYKSLGVDGFLINFNYKLAEQKEEFEKFLDEILNSAFSSNISYSIGPNFELLSETSNILELYKLVEKEVNLVEDFIIPADSDEFVSFPHPLSEVIVKMTTEKYSYISGVSEEMIPADGSIQPLLPEIDIFSQFPANNSKLFVNPKIGLVKAKFFKYTGVGHHHCNVPEKLVGSEEKILSERKAPFTSKTHHFRWNLQGRSRVENWIKLWEKEDYPGWKDVDKYKKMFKVYNSNLLDYKG